MLNRAKRRSAAVENSAPTKKCKMKCGDKPTIVISKKEGEYTVEMQVASENENNCIVYDPLIYKIASASNEERVKRRKKRAKRLMKNMMKEFDDPFHPEACQQSCVRGYTEAVGLLDAAPGSQGAARSETSESCESEAGQESDGSSLGLDWEIQFSPPKARALANAKL